MIPVATVKQKWGQTGGTNTIPRVPERVKVFQNFNFALPPLQTLFF